MSSIRWLLKLQPFSLYIHFECAHFAIYYIHNRFVHGSRSEAPNQWWWWWNAIETFNSFVFFFHLFSFFGSFVDLYSSVNGTTMLHYKAWIIIWFSNDSTHRPIPYAHCPLSNPTCIIHFFFFFVTACSFPIRCALWALTTLHSFRLLFTNNNTIPSFPHFSFQEERAQGKKTNNKNLFIVLLDVPEQIHTHTYILLFSTFFAHSLWFLDVSSILVAAEMKSERNVPELAGMC